MKWYSFRRINQSVLFLNKYIHKYMYKYKIKHSLGIKLNTNWTKAFAILIIPMTSKYLHSLFVSAFSTTYNLFSVSRQLSTFNSDPIPEMSSLFFHEVYPGLWCGCTMHILASIALKRKTLIYSYKYNNSSTLSKKKF